MLPPPSTHPFPFLHKPLFSDALGDTAYSQEHLKTTVYAKFEGQTKCIMEKAKKRILVQPFIGSIYQALSLTLHFRLIGLMHDYGICSKFTTKPRLHKIVHIIWTCNTVHTSVFFTSLFLWHLKHAKILKFDFRI